MTVTTPINKPITRPKIAPRIVKYSKRSRDQSFSIPNQLEFREKKDVGPLTRIETIAVMTAPPTPPINIHLSILLSRCIEPLLFNTSPEFEVSALNRAIVQLNNKLTTGSSP